MSKQTRVSHPIYSLLPTEVEGFDSLAELALDFTCRVLRPGGDFLVKLFQGAGTDDYRRELNERFQKVMVRKPEASRDSSREFYMLARHYNV
jgi:23S rRNA (uridine2552-2'-O)-methyltransferase